MLNCREVTRLLSESQDRTLGLTERMTLKIHLMMCTGCRNFGVQMDTLRQMARAYVKGAGDRHGKQDE
ncbi:zf-HC2 domain-containing protein [Accumulibacter sp.]|uniref:zf-HC2 domain-containing protein n=1 Tax=Accumulibacter sp. TaxID=2053492 RepID=UPI0028C403F5|nr:zf-HC2 domain-containing protein [Accumulibacter sp.]